MSGVVTVEIGGQRYPIRSQLEPTYVIELATYVERKLRVATDSAPSSDQLGLMVLVAMNLADEFFRARTLQSQSHGEVNERALQIEQLVDEALAGLDLSKAVGAS